MVDFFFNMAYFGARRVLSKRGVAFQDRLWYTGRTVLALLRFCYVHVTEEIGARSRISNMCEGISRAPCNLERRLQNCFVTSRQIFSREIVSLHKKFSIVPPVRSQTFCLLSLVLPKNLTVRQKQVL